MNKVYSIAVIGLCIFVLYMIWFAPDIDELKFIPEQPTQVEIDQLDETIIEAGQIWLSETEDPFKEDVYWYVIETKAEYVAFTSVKYNKDKDLWIIPKQITYTTSSKIDIFKRIYKRVK